MDLGAILMGAPPPVEEPNALQRAGTYLDQSPGARAALLSAGLQLMQPVGVGQTALGNLGTAIGNAGATVTAQETLDSKEAAAENKLAVANERLAIARRNQDLKETGALRKGVGGLTEAMKIKFARDEARDRKKEINDDVEAIEKGLTNDDLLGNKNSPNAKYRGKSRQEIRQMLEAERGGGAAGPAPDDSGILKSYPNARKAPDGNYYVPNGTGGYSRIVR